MPEDNADVVVVGPVVPEVPDEEAQQHLHLGMRVAAIRSDVGAGRAPRFGALRAHRPGPVRPPVTLSRAARESRTNPRGACLIAQPRKAMRAANPSTALRIR